MGLAKHEQTIDYLIDLIVDVQTVRSCLTAAERDPRFTPEGYCVPNHCHLAAGSIAILRARQRMGEILRIVPGSSWSWRRRIRDLAAPKSPQGSTNCSAAAATPHCSARPCCRWPGTTSSSALDGRESAFELHANGGMPAWRGRLRHNFDQLQRSRQRVAGSLGIAMPEIDLDHLREMPWAPRRPVTPSLPDGKV